MLCSANILQGQVDPSAYANGFLARLTVNSANQVTSIQPLSKKSINDPQFIKKNMVVTMRVSKNSLEMKKLGNSPAQKIIFAKDLKISKPSLEGISNDTLLVIRQGTYQANSGNQTYTIPIRE
ncbi:hypothetical protein N9933_01350 [bacterium]|nr:hypothetical protein [bacterium]